MRLAADRLARDLQRLHPSFRFEEALAARLAEVAARMRLPAAAGGEGQVVPFRAADAGGSPSSSTRPTLTATATRGPASAGRCSSAAR